MWSSGYKKKYLSEFFFFSHILAYRSEHGPKAVVKEELFTADQLHPFPSESSRLQSSVIVPPA